MSGWQGQRGSRQARGYGKEWERARIRALRRDRYLCQPCLERGRPTAAHQVDHKVPKYKGGTDDELNLQSICADCHAAKTAAEAAEAQGRSVKTRQQVGSDGWPVDRDNHVR